MVKEKVTTKTAGRPSSLSPTIERMIVRTASKERLSADQVVTRLGISVSVLTVRRILQKAQYTEYHNMKCRLFLTFDHRRAREKWAREIVTRDAAFWRCVTFINEKRWCLGGPDGLAYHWADKRLELHEFSRHSRGAGGLMIWGGVSWRGKTALAFIDSKVDKVRYCQMLDDVYQPYVKKYYPNGNIFQQNGAPAHTALYTQEYFVEEGMCVLDCPAKSPDINIIENVWIF